jgi:CysZ protein
MLVALLRAIAALAVPPMRRVVALSLGLAVLIFALLWLAVAAALYDTALFAWRPLNWLADLLGALAVLVLSWLFFPAVVTLVMSFYLERVAAAVEALDYPGRDPPRPQLFLETALATLRLAGLSLLLNLLALPVYLLVPAINLFLFLALNGYLLGRGYFELIAFRRLDAAADKVVRYRHAGRIFLAGVAIAAMFSLPLVNLFAPVIATAFMLHLFEALPRIEPCPPTRSAV